MKAMHAGLFGMALLGVAGPLALTHCSGSDSSATESPDGASSSGSAASGATSGATSSGAGSSGTTAASGSAGSSGSAAASGTGSTGPTGDDGGSGSASGGASGSGSGSGSTGPVPEGGAASDPGMVMCGSTSCNTSEKSCCHKTGDAGSDECVGPNGTCNGGTVTRCDESSDCADGLVCCDTFGSTSCATTCGGGGYQVCRSDSECGTNSDAGAAAKKCIVQTCGGTAAAMGRPAVPATTVQACAYETVPPRTGGGGNPGRGGPPVRTDAAAEPPPPPTWGPLPGCKAE